MHLPRRFFHTHQSKCFDVKPFTPAVVVIWSTYWHSFAWRLFPHIQSCKMFTRLTHEILVSFIWLTTLTTLRITLTYEQRSWRKSNSLGKYLYLPNLGMVICDILRLENFLFSRSKSQSRICTGVTLFVLVLHLNCTALSQSESTNFFMHIIWAIIPCPTNMVSVRVNFWGVLFPFQSSFPRFWGVFNKTILPVEELD